MMEDTINIRCDEYIIKGIITLPHVISKGMILFIGNPSWPSWGPGRITCKAARKFGEYGYMCFRFEIVWLEEVLEESIMLINKYNEAMKIIITYLEKEYSLSIITIIGFCFGSYQSIKLDYTYKERQLVLWSINVSAYDKYCEIFFNENMNVLHDYDKPLDNKRKIPLLIINGDYIKNQEKNRDALLLIFPQKKFDMELKIFHHCDEHFSTLNLQTNVINQTLKWLNYEYEKRGNFK